MSDFSHIELASEKDNDVLLALTRSAAMKADIGMCIERAPNFFQLNMLEGDPWWVWVAKAGNGEIMGCLSQAIREVYLNGEKRKILYCSDLKVFPKFRRTDTANKLIEHMGKHANALGENVPMFMSILEGNKTVENRDYRGLGLPILKRFSSFNIMSLPILWRRNQPWADTYEVRSANESDVPQMLSLWRQVAKDKQLSPVMTEEGWKKWITQSPGLGWNDYKIVQDKSGRIRAFAAFWEQSNFKQTVITSYSPPLKVVRFMFNFIAPFFDAPKLPAEGGKLKFLSAFNFCVPPTDHQVAEVLVWAGYQRAKDLKCPFLSFGVDTTDPLISAFSKFFPQKNVVNVYAAYANKEFNVSQLDRVPVHFEIALV